MIVKKLKEGFGKHKNAVLDSGISQERLHMLEVISKEHNVRFHKFSLTAPKDVLLARVKARAESLGKVFDRDRFEYTYHHQQSKPFKGFTVLDSSRVSPEKIFEVVYAKIHDEKV